MTHSPNTLNLVWISDRQAVNPATIAWIFRGTHGEIEITFSAGEQLSLHETTLSPAGRALLLPGAEETGRAAGHPVVEGNGVLTLDAR